MKVCFFSHGDKYNQDGASLSMLNIMEELTKRGVNVIAIMGYDVNLEEYKKNPRIRFYFVRSYNMRQPLSLVRFKTNVHYWLYDRLNLFYLTKAYHILKKENVDIIHINGINNGIGARVARMLKIPYVWHIRQLMEEDLGQRLFNWKTVKQLMMKANAVIAISNLVRDKFEAQLGRKIDVVYNGVPVNEYILDHKPLFSHSVAELVLAGRIAEGKGQLDAVRAMKQLREWNITNVHLTLIGRMEKDNYGEKLTAYIWEHDLGAMVEIRSHAADLRQVRADGDIGLVCSRKEAFGRVTVETMLAGMLVIGADTGATPELITNGENGYMYRQGDNVDLARCIRCTLEDKEKTREIAKNGCIEASRMYSIERVVDEVLAIYTREMNKIY